MIKKIIIYSILFSFLSAIAWAETTAGQTDTTKQAIQAFTAKNNVPIAAVQIYRDGKLQSIYIGEAKPTTTFDVDSLSRILDGLLLAQQYDAAKLKPTSPLKKFFPAAADNFNKITLRMLATDTSGLPPTATEAYLTNKEQEVLVDENWQPSGFGKSLLIKVLENVSHKPLAELYQKQIFSPLGMKNSKWTMNDIMSSAQDMQKFLAAAIGLPGTPETILYPMRLTQTAFVELPNRMIGLGWSINLHEATEEQEAINSVKDVPERPVFKPDHTYESVSSTVYLAVLPDKKTGVVILLNKPVDEKELMQLGRQVMGKSA